MDALYTFGVSVKDSVLWVSGLLKAGASPGFVVIALVSLLLVLTILFGRFSGRFCTAVKAARKEIEGDEGISGEQVDALSSNFADWRNDGNPDRRRLGVAWKEFVETLVRSPEQGGRTEIGNTVRPSNFFNLADLGVTTGFWRAWPGVFVTLGLLLTFLGLIAALGTIAKEEITDESLSTLLDVASAKFIMSLTGLFCSILFGFVLRSGLGRMEAVLHGLCDTLERRLPYVSLEQVAKDQLAEVRKQSEQTQALITQLIANIDEPLKTGLPNAIRAGIAEAMVPVVEKIGTAGTDGVASSTEALTKRITDDIGGALAQVGEQLATTGTMLEALAGRMDDSSGRMGSEMERAVARLAASVDEMRESAGAAAERNAVRMTESSKTLFAGMKEALDRIQTNTAENGAAMERAATAMTGAAGAFRAEIEAATAQGGEAARMALQGAGAVAAANVGAAGEQVLGSLNTSLTTVTERAEALSEKMSGELFGPLDAMRASLERAADSAARGATEMGRFSAGAEAGAVAAREAADSVEQTAQALGSAAAPIRDTAARFETAARDAAQATGDSARVMKTGAESLVQSAQTAMEAGQAALATERDAIAANLSAVKAALERFETIARNFDDIDDKLGNAFNTYRKEIESALANIGERSTVIHTEHARALDTLTTLVSQTDAFLPQQKRS